MASSRNFDFPTSRHYHLAIFFPRLFCSVGAGLVVTGSSLVGNYDDVESSKQGAILLTAGYAVLVAVLGLILIVLGGVLWFKKRLTRSGNAVSLMWGYDSSMLTIPDMARNLLLDTLARNPPHLRLSRRLCRELAVEPSERLRGRTGPNALADGIWSRHHRAYPWTHDIATRQRDWSTLARLREGLEYLS